MSKKIALFWQWNSVQSTHGNAFAGAFSARGGSPGKGKETLLVTIAVITAVAVEVAIAQSCRAAGDSKAIVGVSQLGCWRIEGKNFPSKTAKLYRVSHEDGEKSKKAESFWHVAIWCKLSPYYRLLLVLLQALFHYLPAITVLVHIWYPAPSPSAPALNLKTSMKLAREMFSSI